MASLFPLIGNDPSAIFESMLSRFRFAEKSPLARRLVMGAGAYGYAQVVSICTQLVSLPLFLSVWDLQTYGTWVVMTAVPFYLSLSDAGISTASANRMISLMAQNKEIEANSVFQSAVAFLLSTTGILLAAIALALALVPSEAFGVHGWKVIFLTLSATVLLQLFCSLAETIYKATQGYAAGTYLVTSGRLVEWLGSVGGLVIFRSFIGVAGSALLARLLYTAFTVWFSGRRTPAIRWGLAHANRTLIQQTAAPGLSFLALSLTSALSLQGFTLLAAAVLGPAAAAIFNAYRTIARVVFQLSGALSNPLWPELGALHGSGRFEDFRRIYRRAFRAGIGIAVAGALVIFAVAPLGLDVWSRGKISYDWQLMGLFAVYVACACSWQIPRVVLMSIDRHGGIALQSAMVAAVSLGIGILFASHAGLKGVVAAMIIGELVMWGMCTRDVRKLPALAVHA